MKPARVPWQRGAVFLACLLCLGSMPARTIGEAVPAQRISPETLPELARDYQDLGLPLPPAGARPLLLPWGYGTGRHGETTRTYIVGFPWAAGSGKNDPGKFLVGTEIWAAGRYPKLSGKPLPLDPDQPLGTKLELAEGHLSLASFPSDAWLSTAIQCEIRGYPQLARQILTRNLMRLSPYFIGGRSSVPDEYDPGANRPWFNALKAGDPRQALAALAWNHWLNAVVQVGTDRREALAHLEQLFAAHPEFHGPAREHFLADLRLTVQPNTGPPGSPEALIDALAEDDAEYLDQRITTKGIANANLQQLLALGYAAVPALLAHMDDRRLLRGVSIPLDCSPQLVSVGSTVTNLVEAAAGRDLYPAGTRPAVGEYDPREYAQRWWEKESKVGEEESVRARAFPAVKNDQEYQWVNSYCLWTLMQKYPSQLGGVYERLLRERPDLDSAEAAKLVAACEGLSRDERLRVLQIGADQPDLAQRNGAISALQRLDPADAEARLLRELARLPRTRSQPRPVMSPEEDVAWTVAHQFDSPAVWRALEDAVRRAEPALRAKLLLRAGGWTASDEEPPRLKQRVALLTKFLDDPAIWHDEDHPEDSKRPQSQLTHTVGNAAAEYLGGLLDIPDYPNVYFSASDWTKYRAAVRRRLTRTHLGL